MASDSGQQDANNTISNTNGYSQYTSNANSNGVSNDDFSTFFNVPTEDSSSQKSMPSWNPNAVDPRLQQGAYDQPSNSWGPPAFQQNSLLANSGQRLATPDMSAAFRQNSNQFFAGANFAGGRESYTAGLPYYQQNLEYTSNGYIPQYYQYPNNLQGQASVHGQTISPSALQGYSDLSNQQSLAYSQSTPNGQNPNISFYGKPANSQSPLRPYDDPVANEFLNASPAGVANGRGLLKDIGALQLATKSKQVGKFLLVSDEVFDSDPVTGISGKIETRKSLNGMKRRIVEQQNGRPWENVQMPLLKRIKYHPRTIKPLAMASGSTAQVELPSSGEESSSEEDSEYESDEEVDEVSPLPAGRPSDPVKAVVYDVIKIVWFKRSKHLGGNTIREALGAYWNLIKPTRDNWKNEINAAAAEALKNDQSKVDKHKAAASRYRTILDSAFRATVQHGHDNIVGKLSENVNLFLSFYQFLVDRFREGDFNGETVSSVLNLMAKCTSTNAALLEKTKLDKILPRLMKKGNASIREMLNKIDETVKANAENITATEKIAKSEDVKPSTVKSAKSNSTSIKPTTTPAAIAKGNATAKVGPAIRSKVVTTSTTTKSTPPLSKPASGTSKVASIKTESKSTDGVLSNSSKAKVVPPTAPLTFAGLLSASKKPGTSNAAQKATLTTDSKPVKPIEEKKSTNATPATKSFSFADAIASIGQTKEVSVKKMEDDKPIETEEERKKRERKEQRRSLRVRWKPDALLVETRVFTHDPEEEIGHNSNMLLDAADVKNEGQMLKLHKEMRIDEEEDLPEESELAPWHVPLLIDHSDLPEDAKQDNYEAFGGSKKPTSPEKTVQEQRERSTLIAIYTSVADIPPCPKEPLDPYSGAIEKEVYFGWGEDAKLKEIRRREAAYYASQQQTSSAATANIQNILSILQQSQQPQPQPHVNLQGFPGFGQALSLLPPQNPQPQQPIPQPGSLEWIVSQLGQQKQAPVAPQPPPPPVVPGGPPIAPAILQALSAFQSMQQNQNQGSGYQMSVPPPPPPSNNVVQPQTTDLSAILAQISGVQRTPHSQPAGYGGDNDKKRSYNDDQYGENKRPRSGNIGR
ncbi:MAG: hypothetical protein GOMPHAMPRED_001345 [Gomphillus americanus]|uniref:Uncharacterized protein n=1 Tax=Gomphillus americanus TaxID=1940652 RepID=A0A8H3F8W3_9LECA|nr:MAG: hypothetical protein GOMPHAMPRED_001345 [Gomphillus americanus]